MGTIKDFNPPILPFSLTALLLLYPAATLPLVQFDLGGTSRTYGLWHSWWALEAGSLTTVTIFLGWCALGATAWKNLRIVLGNVQFYRFLSSSSKGNGFADIWEAPVVLATAIAVTALSLADLASVRLLPGFYSLIALSLVLGLTRSVDPALTKTNGSNWANASTTWSLILTGFIFYIPAMLWPVATFTYKGFSASKTILGSASALLEDGKLTLALIVFVASVAVPLLKLVALTVLNFQYGHDSKTNHPLNGMLHKFVSITGRWALLDLFVVIALISLVDFGLVANVSPEPKGIYVFCGMVIATLLAAESAKRSTAFHTPNSIK